MTHDYPNKQFWIEFLELYKSLPSLWKVKSDNYKNRALKSESYEEMVSKIQEVYPNADRDFVKKKINTLRTSYRRELGKLKTAKETGDSYMPTLWYFSLIDFLRNQENYSSVDSDNEENTNSNSEDVVLPAPTPRKRIKKRPLKFHEPYKITESHILLDENPFAGNSNTNCESEIIAKCWENEYNKLTPEQQMYAKKAIDDVLFEGRLGLLQKNSVMINAPHTFALISPQNIQSTSREFCIKDPPNSE